MASTVQAVTPAWHEVTMELVYDDGLDAYFAADAAVKDAGGSTTVRFTDADGRTWVAKLYYQDSNILSPVGTLPSGREWSLETVREFRLHVARVPDEDPVGEQKVNYHLRPRWDGMRVENSDGDRSEFDTPVREGVSIRATGANIAADRYTSLLADAAAAVGLRRSLVRDPHPTWSTLQDAERYVRVAHDASGPVHARDGPIARMGHLLEHDRQGYRKVVQQDHDGHGETLPGYYHTVTLGPRRVREAFPSHSMPAEVKHYYAREAASKPDDDPLAHPKVGVSYQVSRWDGKVGVTDDDLDEAREELDRVLHAVLADAELELAPTHGSGPYVEDAYFTPEVGEFREPPALNMADLEHDQESVVIKHLSDGLSPCEIESIETLVSDGGRVSPADIAEEHGRNVQSVRRALSRIDDLVKRSYGEVALRSPYVADLLHRKVEQAREASRDLADATGQALMAAERGLDERTSALLAWCASHGVDVDHRGDAIAKIRLGEVGSSTEAKQLIRKGFRLWTDAGREPGPFRSAQVKYRKNGDVRRVPRAGYYLPR